MKALFIFGLAVALLVGNVAGGLLIGTALGDLPVSAQVIVGFVFGFFYTGWMLKLCLARLRA